MAEPDDDVAMIITRAVKDQSPEETYPGSEIRWCDLCADEVWLSPNALQFIEDTKDHVKVFCYDCGVGVAITADTVQARSLPGSEARIERPVMEMFKRDVKAKRRER